MISSMASRVWPEGVRTSVFGTCVYVCVYSTPCWFKNEDFAYLFCPFFFLQQEKERAGENERERERKKEKQINYPQNMLPDMLYWHSPLGMLACFKVTFFFFFCYTNWILNTHRTSKVESGTLDMLFLVQLRISLCTIFHLGPLRGSRQKRHNGEWRMHNITCTPQFLPACRCTTKLFLIGQGS